MQQIGNLLGDRLRATDILRIEPRWKKVGYVGMSNKVLYDRRISIGAKTLYWYLMSRCFQKDDCFPGNEKIAYDLNVGSNKTIVKYKKELEEVGVLRVKRRWGKTNIYTLRF